MNNVQITVLMPCYNAADFIAVAIESVLQQSFREFELLIINDGSTDETVSVIQSFNDERIVLLHQSQQGVAGALNYGLSMAKGMFIARFDADDICFPHRLEKQFSYMKENPDCILVGSAAEYIDASGNYVFTYASPAKTNDEIRALPFNVCPFIHASVMYKKAVIIQLGYNIHAHSFEDHLLWQQLKSAGKMCNLPEALLSVRLNPASLTIDERKRPRLFRQVKNKALKTGNISAVEGGQLLEIIKSQNTASTKEGAYYSLLAKKFLWDNYDPARARQNLRKAIDLNSFDIKDYGLWAISYLPKNMISNIYSTFDTVR